MKAKFSFIRREEKDTSGVLLRVACYLLLYLLLSRLFLRLAGLAAGTALDFLRFLLPPLAFLLPLAFFCLHGERPVLLCPPQKGSVTAALPLFPLFLIAVMLCAYLTGLAMDVLGLPATGGGVAGTGFFSDLLRNCLLPALLEELFFRGLILSLLYQKMGRGAIWLSGVIFALAHGSLYQLPYAFVGGVFLSLAAVVGGSVLVPFLFHFANNFLSLALQYTPRAWIGGVVLPLVYAGVALAALASLLYLKARRDTPAGAGVRALFASPRECGRVVLHATFASPLAFYLIPMLILTIVRAFA